MKVEFPFGEITGKRTVVTVGCFDGVHLGHLSILDRVKSLAQQNGLISLVASFDPHPRAFLYGQGPLMLSPNEERTSLLQSLGIGAHALIAFDGELASMSATDYVEQILIGKLHAKGIVIGYDHRFGRNREGDLDLLKALAAKHELIIEECPARAVDGAKISSSTIRDEIGAGKVAAAAKGLGRFYSFEGSVVRGDGRGKSIGIPTANIRPKYDVKLLPKNGVYAVISEVEGISGRLKGMVNIGTRPTFNNDTTVTLEVNIFDFDQDIYDREVRVEFVERIRNEEKFASVGHLIEQLNKDRERCNRLLSEML
ncbi:MAG: bifunctional riboflavin kinase/FAD synthetase [Bacteroidetes bacterium]|nr:bifunctional riboflavin kinase/FAD synthetase [Bacteroidota bacterium]